MHIDAINLPKLTMNNLEFSGLSDWDCLKSLLSNKDLEEVDIIKAFSDFENLTLDSHYGIFELLPGVRETLEVCLLNGWDNAVLSGNTKRRAIHKLESTQIIDYFSHELFFCCESGESRFDIASRAARIKSNYNRYVIIGDTPLDIEVGKKINIPTISVSTGNFPYEVLYKLNPGNVFINFKNQAQRLIKHLDSV